MKKKIYLMLLSMSIISCFNINTYANANDFGNNYSENNVKIDNYATKENLTVIDKNDVPEHIIPMQFDSDEQAIDYINSNFKNISNPYDIDEGISQLATDEDVFVDSAKAGVGTVTLRANYGTTGNSNTGKISYISPYITHTGYTLAIEWNESNKGYNILSNGKDAYIYMQMEH